MVRSPILQVLVMSSSKSQVPPGQGGSVAEKWRRTVPSPSFVRGSPGKILPWLGKILLRREYWSSRVLTQPLIQSWILKPPPPCICKSSIVDTRFVCAFERSWSRFHFNHFVRVRRLSSLNFLSIVVINSTHFKCTL